MDVGGLLGNEAIRARLDAAAAQDRFSHSYLICGPDGSGKHTLAKILAAAMQCTGAGRKPCGRRPDWPAVRVRYSSIFRSK